MTALSDLIARLEAAKGGSRELDNLVAPIAGWKRITPSVAKRAGLSCRSNGGWIAPEDIRDGEVMLDSLHGTTIYRDPPQFTRSLDAALTLGHDANMRNVLMQIVIDNCLHEGWDIARQGARLFCAEVLKAREAGR